MSSGEMSEMFEMLLAESFLPNSTNAWLGSGEEDEGGTRESTDSRASENAEGDHVTVDEGLARAAADHHSPACTQDQSACVPFLTWD